MVGDMLDHPTFSAERVKTVKTMLAGGGPIPPTQVARMRSKAKKVGSGQAYGLTETFGAGTANSGIIWQVMGAYFAQAFIQLWLIHIDLH